MVDPVGFSIAALPPGFQRGIRGAACDFTPEQLRSLETAFHTSGAEARTDETLLDSLEQEGIERAHAQEWFRRRAQHANVPAELPGASGCCLTRSSPPARRHPPTGMPARQQMTTMIGRS